jgi:hypothetical protein
MGTSHGNAYVTPEGKVKLQVMIDEDLYRRLFEWSKSWGLSMSEGVNRTLRMQADQVLQVDS